MDKEKFLSSGLIEQYALGLASPEEMAEVERYAASFPDIQKLVDSIQESLEKYAQSVIIEPPAELRTDTFNEIDTIESYTPNSKSNNSAQSGSSSKSLWIGLLALASIGLAVSNYFSWKKQDNLQQTVSELQVAFTQCEEEKNALQNSNKVFASMNSFLKDENTLHVHLRGTALAPEALAVAFWNEETESAFLKIVNLPAPQPDKQYQLWADVHGEMKSLGVIEQKDQELLEIPYLADAESLNVTLEKRGGALKPDVSQLFANGNI